MTQMSNGGPEDPETRSAGTEPAGTADGSDRPGPADAAAGNGRTPGPGPAPAAQPPNPPSPAPSSPTPPPPASDSAIGQGPRTGPYETGGHGMGGYGAGSQQPAGAGGSHSPGGTGGYSTNPYGVPAYGAGSPPPNGIGGEPPRRGGGGRAGMAGIVIASLLGLTGIGVGVAALTQNNNSPTSSGSAVATVQVAPPVSNSAAPGSVQQVAHALLPSVVSITVTDGRTVDEGTGIILTKDGFIATNNHVVSTASGAGSRGQIVVAFNDGSNTTATVVGTDVSSDLAVIKVNGKNNLTPATLGKSSELQVGQQVVAIGSPLGLSGTVTSGIVSALNRPVNTTASQQQDGGGFGQQAPTETTVIDAIQTDAAINPGNSGGPLVDTSGRVVGINSAIASLGSGEGQSGNIGVGFSIPIDEAWPTLQQLMTTGHAVHAMLGVKPQDATTSNGIIQLGAQVNEVVQGSPAQQAGLQPNDIITKLGDRTIDSADSLVAAVRSHQPGDKIPVTFLRNGQQQTATITLGTQSG